MTTIAEVVNETVTLTALDGSTVEVVARVLQVREADDDSPTG